ncbi:putative secreted protein (Por secretion system target) [Flavobacteriaceae bacterium MAR_2010_72]|nr:putative secreted protein (Por secretion system target) [Flavobacteriaceae bacterium MAR_2010_72]TVZ60060.1 putative secreted protein (Por secretion system target) [Flavobacteriaceae bacterium MAR_2010_105]
MLTINTFETYTTMKKTTPNNLTNRLSQYGALTAAIAGVVDANGQVNYTDLGSSQIDQANYALDVDNNTVPEFNFYQNSNYLLVRPNFSNAAILGSSINSYIYPLVLNSNAVISNAQNDWFISNGFYQTMNFNNCQYGNWCDPTTDKYLGLYFSISGQRHYGWARISVYNLPGLGDYPNSGWAITGYAYEQTPNTAILAGDTGTLGIEDQALNRTKIVALHKSIAISNLPNSTNYALYALTGQKVMEGITHQDTYVIEADALANGVYVLELKDNSTKSVLKKKIVL